MAIEELRAAIVLDAYNQPHAFWWLHLLERAYDLPADRGMRDDALERLRIIGLHGCQRCLMLFVHDFDVLRVKSVLAVLPMMYGIS